MAVGASPQSDMLFNQQTARTRVPFAENGPAGEEGVESTMQRATLVMPSAASQIWYACWLWIQSQQRPTGVWHPDNWRGPLVLEKELANFFRHRGDERPRRKGGEQSRADVAEGTDSAQAQRGRLGGGRDRPPLTARGIPPQSKQTLQRRRRPLQAARGRAPGGRKGRQRPARTAAKRSPKARGRRRRGVQRNLKDRM